MNRLIRYVWRHAIAIQLIWTATANNVNKTCSDLKFKHLSYISFFFSLSILQPWSWTYELYYSHGNIGGYKRTGGIYSALQSCFVLHLICHKSPFHQILKEKAVASFLALFAVRIKWRTVQKNFQSTYVLWVCEPYNGWKIPSEKIIVECMYQLMR